MKSLYWKGSRVQLARLKFDERTFKVPSETFVSCHHESKQWTENSFNNVFLPIIPLRKYSPCHWGKQWAANGQFISSLLAPSSREDEKLSNLSAPERLYASASQHCHPLSDKEDSMEPLGNHSLSTGHELRENVISFLGEIPVTWCERWTKKTRRTRVPVYPRPLSQKWSCCAFSAREDRDAFLCAIRSRR